MFIIISIFAVCVNAAVLVAGYKMINRRLNKMQASIIVEINNVLDTVSPSPYDDAPDFAVETETAAPVEVEPEDEVAIPAPVVKMAVVADVPEVAPVVEQPAAEVDPEAPAAPAKKSRKPAAPKADGETSGSDWKSKAAARGETPEVIAIREAILAAKKVMKDDAASDADKLAAKETFRNNERTLRKVVAAVKAGKSFADAYAEAVADTAPAKKSPAAKETPATETPAAPAASDTNDKPARKPRKKADDQKDEPAAPAAPEFETAGQHTKGDLIEMTMNAFKTESILIKDLGVTFSAGATTPVIIAVIKKDGVLMFTHQNTDCTKILTKTCSSNFISRDLMAQIYEAVTTSVLAEWHTAHPVKNVANDAPF